MANNIPDNDAQSDGTSNQSPKNKLATIETGNKQSAPVPVMLALQGGGSHSALTWGVLDFLLERQDKREIEITAISGTSGGAINAALVAYGLQSSPKDAQRCLAEFWEKNSDAAILSLNPFCIPVPFFGNWNIDWYPWVMFLQSLGLAFSPYQKLPSPNFFRLALTSCIKFEVLNKSDGPEVYVIATNARTGQFKTFDKKKISVDAVLASACIPTAFQAVVLDGDPYWDGGYLKDPALFPLVNKEKSGDDILIIGVNPFQYQQPYFPWTAWQIADRINELSFNSSLMAEVEKVLLVNNGLRQEEPVAISTAGEVRRVAPAAISAASEVQCKEPEKQKKHFWMHYLEPPPAVTELGVMSKSNSSYPFVRNLFYLGRQAAEDWWWSKCRRNLGRAYTDIDKIVGNKSLECDIRRGADHDHANQDSTDDVFGVAPNITRAAM